MARIKYCLGSKTPRDYQDHEITDMVDKWGSIREAAFMKGFSESALRRRINKINTTPQKGNDDVEK